MLEVETVEIAACAIVNVMIDEKTLDRIDARMSARTGVQVDSVEVDAELIGAVVAARHSVRIEHGHELEDELAAQNACARVVGAQEELEKPVEDERRRRLARMHATREHEHALLVEAEAAWRVRVRKETVRIEARLTSIRDLMVRADRDQIDASLVQRLGEQLAVVVDLIRITLFGLLFCVNYY